MPGRRRGSVKAPSDQEECFLPEELGHKGPGGGGGLRRALQRAAPRLTEGLISPCPRTWKL